MDDIFKGMSCYAESFLPVGVSNTVRCGVY